LRRVVRRSAALALAALCSACGAPDECSSVAKLVFHAAEHKSEVKVLRGSQDALREVKSDRLCAGDRVRVPRGIVVDVKYLEAGSNEHKLEGPGEYPVLGGVRAGTPLGNLLKSADVFGWFREDGPETGVEAALSRSVGMTSPLAAGQSPQVPLYVKSSLRDIAFFWSGGAAPWRVELADASGRVLSAAEVREPTAMLSRFARPTDEEYQLSVRSADGLVLTRKLKFEPDAQTPRESAEPDWAAIVAMLSDPDRNWRLQVWSELRTAPDSGMKAAVMKRLQTGALR